MREGAGRNDDGGSWWEFNDNLEIEKDEMAAQLVVVVAAAADGATTGS